MASTIQSLQAELQAEIEKLGFQMDEETRLNTEIGLSIAELLKMGMSRQDTGILISVTKEVTEMNRIHDDGVVTVEDVLAKLAEAQTAETTNPSEYHAALTEILAMTKRATSFRAASIAELKGVQSRLKELLDREKAKS